VVNGGRLEIDSDTGSSSNFHNPFTIIRNNDTYYGFNLIYSGNHKTSVEVNDYDHIRIETGINDFLFSYKLKPGETFFAPEALIEVADSIDYLSSSFHKLINSHIIPERFEKRIPPILFNSWEGVYFDFNQEKLLKMAKEAKDLGAELFVVDDGWFGHRNDDSSSLGDWVDNPLKTGGLKNLADKVRSLGLQFGIWMEPEMISEDSDLFKKHPEYAMRIPNREPNRQRNQLMLDLTNDEVVKFIIDSVSNVLDLSKASYLKWDYNRNFSDVYSSSFNSFEYGYRYIVNLYKIMDVLTKKYPSVLFEGCASGGARFDLGILSFFPQIWCSDNTDPLSRLFIQTGSLIGYPAKVMCCHVSKPINDVTKRKSRLLDRFQIALMGNLGYELDPTKLSNQDRKDIKQEIGFYKGFRKFSFFADSYLLGDCYNSNISGDMLINFSKSKAFLIVALTGSYRGYLKIRGLNPKFSYQVNHHGKAYLGSYLMDKGIFINQSISKLKKDYTCQIMTFCYELERIKGE
jgi:alpha-galactosidase